MKHVDALSRDPVEPSGTDIEDTLIDKLSVFNIMTREEEIALFQYSDDELKQKIDILKRDNTSWTVSEKNEVREYNLKNGLLYKTIKCGDITKDLFVVPPSMRKTIVIKYHDFSGHQGADKVTRKISEYYYFPRMKGYVDNHIRMCLECILSKNRVGKQPGYLHPIPPGKRPFEIVHIDHLGPFVTTPRGNNYMLILIDNLTKFVQLESVKTTKSEHTIQKLTQFVNRFGAPVRIVTDRGTSFTSKKFQDFCNKYGIKHTLNSSRHPQANGLVERLNGTILPMMQSTVENCGGNDWDKHTKTLERNINTTVNKTTSKTPFEMLYGYIPRFTDGQVRSLTIENETYRLPEVIREEVRQHVEDEQQNYKRRYDKHRCKGLTYRVGDIVYMKAPVVSTGYSTKLQSRYKGPYTIVEVLPSDTYRITRLCDQATIYNTTAHVSQLKIWRNCNTEEDDPIEENALIEERNEDVDNDRMKKREVKTQIPIVEAQEQRQIRIKTKPNYLKDYVCD